MKCVRYLLVLHNVLYLYLLNNFVVCFLDMCSLLQSLHKFFFFIVVVSLMWTIVGSKILDVICYCCCCCVVRWSLLAWGFITTNQTKSENTDRIILVFFDRIRDEKFYWKISYWWSFWWKMGGKICFLTRIFHLLFRMLSTMNFHQWPSIIKIPMEFFPKCQNVGVFQFFWQWHLEVSWIIDFSKKDYVTNLQT